MGGVVYYIDGRVVYPIDGRGVYYIDGRAVYYIDGRGVYYIDGRGCLLYLWEGCLPYRWEGCLLYLWEGCIVRNVVMSSLRDCCASLEQIGEGAYGHVYRATHRTYGTVALKRMLVHKPQTGFPLNFVRGGEYSVAYILYPPPPSSSLSSSSIYILIEIKFLKALKHKNVVQLLEIITSQESTHEPGTVYTILYAKLFASSFIY